jgi:hypothetical protein
MSPRRVHIYLSWCETGKCVVVTILAMAFKRVSGVRGETVEAYVDANMKRIDGLDSSSIHKYWRQPRECPGNTANGTTESKTSQPHGDRLNVLTVP